MQYKIKLTNFEKVNKSRLKLANYMSAVYRNIFRPKKWINYLLFLSFRLKNHGK